MSKSKLKNPLHFDVFIVLDVYIQPEQKYSVKNLLERLYGSPAMVYEDQVLKEHLFDLEEINHGVERQLTDLQKSIITDIEKTMRQKKCAYFRFILPS